LLSPSDLFVAVRVPRVFDASINASQKWLWLQDWDQGGELQPPRLSQIDRVVVVSFWHETYIRQQYGVAANRFFVSRNGIDLARFDVEPVNRKRHCLIYSSSPDRGLDRILTMWPMIRKIWPDAELHTFYGWRAFDRSMEMAPALRAEYETFRSRMLGAMEQPGIVQHNRVDQWHLARAFMASEVWLYPTRFCETGCITALEAQAAGAIPVTNNLAALGEVVRGGIVLPPDSDDDAYLDGLARLNDPDLAKELRRIGRQHARTFSWRNIAREWHIRLQADRKVTTG
jgi:glycosyltransferase involved in cell wall biosynthesis